MSTTEATTTTSTTLDLGPLLDLWNAVEPIHDELIAQINADDTVAFQRGEALLERESIVIEEITATFDLRFGGDRGACDDLRSALHGLSSTGNVTCAIDGYRERRQRDATLAKLPAFLDLLRDDPTVMRGESNLWINIIEITLTEALVGLFQTCQPETTDS